MTKQATDRDVLQRRREGLYCPAGDFFIDPTRAVDRAIITHAHSDHARSGSRRYLTSDDGQHVLRSRLNKSATIETLRYGERLRIGDATVSLHPAGHLLGSSQVRVEVAGEVWVVSGDYRNGVVDQTCTPFEPVRCHCFVTESTFAMPVYQWPKQSSVFDQINRWWRENVEQGRTSVIGAYSLGKSQRILAGLDPTIGPIVCHHSVETCNDDYRKTGIDLPHTTTLRTSSSSDLRGKAMVIAPSTAINSAWIEPFGEVATAFASGWMMLKRGSRRHNVDRGFILSDHADWPGLLEAIDETRASRVLATHGSTNALVRYLREERGLDAHDLAD